ncbi:MAG TPA: hypothetical protein VFI91_02810 [Longimicrobiaceae bacterium]|nr:hypothetical protein [Longimicrobiaceae bacterium]
MTIQGHFRRLALILFGLPLIVATTTPAVSQVPVTISIPENYPAFDSKIAEPGEKGDELQALIVRRPDGNHIILNPSHVNLNVLDAAINALYNSALQVPQLPTAFIALTNTSRHSINPGSRNIVQKWLKQLKEQSVRQATPIGSGRIIEVNDLTPAIRSN